MPVKRSHASNRASEYGENVDLRPTKYHDDQKSKKNTNCFTSLACFYISDSSRDLMFIIPVLMVRTHMSYLKGNMFILIS